MMAIDRLLPPFFSVGRTFADEAGTLERIWACAAGREARLYHTAGGGPVLLVDGEPVAGADGVVDVFFSPDGQRMLILRDGAGGGRELMENGAVLCTGSHVKIWFSPDRARWALRWCDPDGDEVCQVDGVEVHRTRWDHYMGGSGWQPPWEPN